MRSSTGIEFEADVFDQLKSRLGGHQYADLSTIGVKSDAVDATVDAMDRDVLLILGG
ncbi:MAG TPA: hypothetical protein VLB29_19750 [Nocardioidaceae bacterium]|nr:hypothetical protein [Nocardioidaceae bacterium]